MVPDLLQPDESSDLNLTFFLGGGFVLGGLTGDAELCMLMRNRVGIIVMDVDYRLSPGENYPTRGLLFMSNIK
jgi:acetyl esterase/lipase